MANILRRRPLRPYSVYDDSVEIDWSKPHSRGLVCFIHPKVSGGIDLVTNRKLAAQNGAILENLRRGPMINCNATNRGLQGPASGVHFTFPANQASILWAGSVPTTASMTNGARMCSVSYDDPQASPYDVIAIQSQANAGNFFPAVAWNGTAQGPVIGPFTADPDYCQAVGVIETGRQETWSNGVLASTTTNSISSITHGTAPPLTCGTFPSGAFSMNTVSWFQNMLLWNQALPRAAIRDLWIYGPGIVLRKRPKYFLVKAAVASVSDSGSPTGVQASAAVGTLTVGAGVNAPITGVAASPGVGTVIFPSVSVPIVGVAANAAVGTLAASIPATALIVGVQAHALAQAPSVSLGSIIGIAASPGVGTLTVTTSHSAAADIAGVAASPGVGTLAVGFGSIRGVAASPGVGTLTLSIDANAEILGVAAASAAGTAVGQVAVSLATITGVAASSAVGTVMVTATARIPISGIAAHTAVGSVLAITSFRALMIAGVDRSYMLRSDSLDVHRDIAGQTSASFTMYDRRGQFVPQYGDEVAYYFLGRRIFGGIVESTQHRAAESRIETFIQVNCVGYQQIAMDRTYARKWVGPTLDLRTIVRDIVDVGLAGEVLTYPADSETSTISALRFELAYDTVWACLEKVAAAWGYNRFIDNDGVIHMERVNWKPAPYLIRDQAGQDGIWRQMRISRDASQYRNRQGARCAIPVEQSTANTDGAIVFRDDTAEQARHALATGGSGIVEQVTTARNFVDRAAALSYCDALLNRFGRPTTKVEFESDLPFWEIGQIVSVFTTSPPIAGLYQIRGLAIKEMGLTFLRYQLTLQAPSLPEVVGIDVTDNGDGSNTLTVDMGRPIDFSPGDPLNLSGFGDDNLKPNTGTDGFREDGGTRIIAIQATIDGGSWVLTLTVEALYVKATEAVRLANILIVALGGHGAAFGAPVDRINGTWNIHSINIPAKQILIYTAIDGNPTVDFTGLLYQNAPEGLYYASEKMSGLDGNWLTDGSGVPNDNSLTIVTGQTLHILSIQVQPGGIDENDWIVQLNVDHVPTLVFKDAGNILMPAVHEFTINGMRSDNQAFETSNAVLNYTAVQKAVLAYTLQFGLNGTWTSFDVGIAPEMWIKFRTNSAPNRPVNLNQFLYRNSPNATVFFFGDGINPPLDLPPGPVDVTGPIGGYSGIPTVAGEDPAVNDSGVGAKTFTIVDVNNTTRVVTTAADHGFTTSYPGYSGSVVRIFGVTEPRQINGFPIRITVTGPRTFIDEEISGFDLANAAGFINDGHGQVTETGARVNLASSPVDTISHLLGLTAGNSPLITERATFFLPNGIPGIPSRGLVEADNVTNPWVAQNDISIVDSVYVTLETPGMGDVGVPGSGDVHIDVTLNGVSILAAGYVSFPGGTNDPVLDRGLAENPTVVLQGDELNVSVKKTGTTFPGCNATVVVNLKG